MLIRKAACPMEPSTHGTPKRVLLRHGVLPQVPQVAEGAYEAPFEVKAHVHPTMYEIFYILEGTAIYTVGGEQHTVFPGDLVIVPPATPHSVSVTQVPHRTVYWGIATGPPPGAE